MDDLYREPTQPAVSVNPDDQPTMTSDAIARSEDKTAALPPIEVTQTIPVQEVPRLTIRQRTGAARRAITNRLTWRRAAVWALYPLAVVVGVSVAWLAPEEIKQAVIPPQFRSEAHASPSPSSTNPADEERSSPKARNELPGAIFPPTTTPEPTAPSTDMNATETTREETASPSTSPSSSATISEPSEAFTPTPSATPSASTMSASPSPTARPTDQVPSATPSVTTEPPSGAPSDPAGGQSEEAVVASP